MATILMDKLDIDNLAIGIDIEENSRFSGFTREKDNAFLSKIFTEQELDYCFVKTDPAPSLCARFAAKEAAIKAMKSLGYKKINPKDIEIISDPDGSLALEFRGYKFNSKISISHNKLNSISIVMLQKYE